MQSRAHGYRAAATLLLSVLAFLRHRPRPPTCFACPCTITTTPRPPPSRRKLSATDKALLLADLTWLLAKGAVKRPTAGGMFGKDGPASFRALRNSDVPLLVAGIHEAAFKKAEPPVSMVAKNFSGSDVRWRERRR